MVVDDLPENLRDAIELLSPFGITPTTARNGAEALAKACGRHFDLILMDVSMPVMDGLEAALHIRQHEAEHPERPRATIVAYTAGQLLAEVALLARAGFDEAMRKPCSALQLQACLHRLHPTKPVLESLHQRGASLRTWT